MRSVIRRVEPVTAHQAAGPPPATLAESRALDEAEYRRRAGVPPVIGDAIPEEVWAEVDRAAELFEDLASEGRRIVFDLDRLTGEVVASLVHPDGNAQPMGLDAIFDPTETR